MDNFINLLKKLEADNDIKVADILDYDVPNVSVISIMAESLLINESGHCNWENIEIMKKEGYYVFPLERDSFGWLIGGISTNKGVIAYG